MNFKKYINKVIKLGVTNMLVLSSVVAFTQADPAIIEVSADKSPIAVDEETTLRVKGKNLGDAQIDVNFPQGYQVTIDLPSDFYAAEPQDASALEAIGGGWNITYENNRFTATLTSPLAAGEAFEFAINVKGLTDSNDINIGTQVNSTFGPFIAGGENPNNNEITNGLVVPIELVSFVAIASNNDAELTWVTSSEMNNSHFVIMRTTTGLDFEEVGTVNGAGTSSEENTYSFTDVGAAYLGNNVYYKLVQVDFDGSTTNAGIRKVEFEDVLTDSVIYPNPVNLGETIYVKCDYIQSLDVFSINGQLVLTMEDQNSNVVGINTAGFAPGSYIVLINKKEELKFIVK